MILEPEARTGIDRGGQQRVLGRRGEADLDADVATRARRDAGVAQLLARLLGVPAVGDEQRVVAGHQQQCGRPGEPGEVPDVRELGDEQRVELLGNEALAESCDARRDVERGKRGGCHVAFPAASPRRAATASIARR